MIQALGLEDQTVAHLASSSTLFLNNHGFLRGYSEPRNGI